MLHKKTGDPSSLLIVIIAAKSITNRIERALPSVINSNQTGFGKKTGLLAKLYEQLERRSLKKSRLQRDSNS